MEAKSKDPKHIRIIDGVTYTVRESVGTDYSGRSAVTFQKETPDGDVEEVWVESNINSIVVQGWGGEIADMLSWVWNLDENSVVVVASRWDAGSVRELLYQDVYSSEDLGKVKTIWLNAIKGDEEGNTDRFGFAINEIDIALRFLSELECMDIFPTPLHQ